MVHNKFCLALYGFVLLVFISLCGRYLRYYSIQHYVLYYMPQTESYIKLTPYWNNYYLGFSEDRSKLKSYRLKCPKDCDYVRISRKEDIFYSYWIFVDLESPGRIYCRMLNREDCNGVTMTFNTHDFPDDDHFPDSIFVTPFEEFPKRYAVFNIWDDSLEGIGITNLANCSIIEIERVNM